MQSDGNSFGGDVVLNSFNKASRDEDNILDQVYLNYKDLKIFALFWSKMLSLSRNTLLSSTRRHPRKNYSHLIASHCIYGPLNEKNLKGLYVDLHNNLM